MRIKQTTRLWKFSGGVLGLLALLAILIAVNVVLSAFRFRKDLTQDKIYTLCDGTRAIIEKLDSHVTLKFFFKSGSPEVPTPIKPVGRKVADLLRE